MVKLTKICFASLDGQDNSNKSANAEDPPQGCYHFTSPVNHQVNGLLPNGVVAPSIVVGSIFFATDELLWVEECAVGPGPDLIWRKLRTHERHWHKIHCLPSYLH